VNGRREKKKRPACGSATKEEEELINARQEKRAQKEKREIKYSVKRVSQSNDDLSTLLTPLFLKKREDATDGVFA
jgi:hypothetical protein